MGSNRNILYSITKTESPRTPHKIFLSSLEITLANLVSNASIFLSTSSWGDRPHTTVSFLSIRLVPNSQMYFLRLSECPPRVISDLPVGYHRHNVCIGLTAAPQARLIPPCGSQDRFRPIPMTTGAEFPFDSIENSCSTLCSTSPDAPKASLILSSGMSSAQSH